jgi:hypothetical protein
MRVTHELIRRILPKGTSFEELVQDDINLMMSHINSYNRKKLNNQSAYQLFSFLNSEEILETLSIKLVPANEINLTPLRTVILQHRVQIGNSFLTFIVISLF